MSRRLRCSAIVWALLLVTSCGVPAPPPTTASATVASSPGPSAAGGGSSPSATATLPPGPGTPAPAARGAASSTAANPRTQKPPTPTVPSGPAATRTIAATVKIAPDAEEGPLGERFVTAFVDATHGWRATGTTIRATSDGGRSWVKQYTAPGIVSALDFVSVRQGWAATQAGLITTRDGGTTWERIGDTPIGPMDFVDAEHGWAVAGAGYNARVLHTDDGGRTWLPTPAPCVKKGDPDPGPGLLSFISPTVGWLLCGGSSVGTAQQKQLFKTEDGGRQWTLLASSTYDESRGLPSHERARSLFFLDDQHGWLGTLDCCLYATNDGGRSWQPLRVFGGPVWKAFFISPEQGFVDTEGSLLGTWDSGTSWARLYPPFMPGEQSRFFDGRNGISVGDGGAILRTTDGGENWQQVGSLEGEWVWSLSFPDARHGWVLAGPASQLFRTTDGGATWTLLPPSPRRFPESPLTISFVDRQTGFASDSWGRLLVTRDGGVTFARLDAAESPTGNCCFAFVNETEGWKRVGEQVEATSDGGKSWKRVPLSYRVGMFDLLPGGRAWVVTRDCGTGGCRGTLLSTTDGGATWTGYDLGALNPSRVRFADAVHGWLWDYGGHFYRTEDGGLTWVQLR